MDVDSVVALRMKKFLLGTDKDVMFIAAYLPPYDSNYWKVTQHGYGMEFIEKCVMDLHDVTDDFSLLLCGKKAVFNLCTSFQKCREMAKETFFKIFDSKIQSVLLYSSEIWGLHILDSIERVHLMACKRYLGMPSRTPNKMVYGELGRYPLFIAPHVRCIKYWFRLLYMEQSRLPNQAYRMLVNLDENGKQCWATEVRELLCKTGFYFVWLQQGVGDVKSFLYVFKQRLLDMFTQERTSDIRDKERYEMYRSFKVMFGAEKYLSVIDIYCFRVALTQLRLGVLPINSNMYSYSDCPTNKNCVFCQNQVENEDHFLLVCPLYTPDARFNQLQKGFILKVTPTEEANGPENVHCVHLLLASCGCYINICATKQIRT